MVSIRGSVIELKQHYALSLFVVTAEDPSRRSHGLMLISKETRRAIRLKNPLGILYNVTMYAILNNRSRKA